MTSFICPRCGISFNSQFKLSRHLEGETEYSVVTFNSAPILHTNTLQTSSGLTISLPTSAGTIATTEGDQTITNKTLDGVVIQESTITDSTLQNPTVADSTDATKGLTFLQSGATTGTNTQLVFAQSANRVITFPNVTGTVLTDTSTATIYGKTFADSSVTSKTLAFDLSGSAASTSLTLATIQGSGSSSTLRFPDVGNGTTDTLVACSATQVLTNKSVEGKLTLRQTTTVTSSGSLNTNTTPYSCVAVDTTSGAIVISNVVNAGLTTGNMLVISKINSGGSNLTLTNANTSGGNIAFTNASGTDVVLSGIVAVMYIFNGTSFVQIQGAQVVG